MNPLNEIATDKSLSSLSSSSSSSSTQSSITSNPISLLSNRESEKPNYFKYKPTNDSELVDRPDDPLKICGASNFLDDQVESDDDFDENEYLQEKLRLFDKPKSLMNGMKSTVDSQLIKSYEKSSSALQLPVFKSVPGCLDSTIQEDDDDDV